MGTIRKRKGKSGASWIAEVCIDRQRKSRSFKSKDDASDWIREQERGGLLDTHNLHDALEKYRPMIEKLKGRQPALSRLNSLKSRLPNLPLEAFDYKAFERWREKRFEEVGGNSLNREAGMLKIILELCVTWNWLHKSPLKTIPREKDKPPRQRGIAQWEIDRVCEELKKSKYRDQLIALFLLAIETGARLSELTGLTWDRVKEEYFSLMDTKNDTPRDVPLSQKARDIVNQRKGLHKTKLFSLKRLAESKLVFDTEAG